MGSKLLLPILCFLSLITTGCWDQKIIEKKYFVRELGLEASANREILFTFVGPDINKQSGKRDQIITAEASLIREGIKRGDFFTGGDIEIADLRHLLISEELAQRGIHSLLEAFERDPAQASQASLLIVEGSPSQLLREMAKNKQIPTNSLERIFKSSNQSYLSELSIGEFQIAYFTPGIDPTLPLIRYSPAGTVLNGAALFVKDRMVGKVKLDQTVFLMAMMNRLKRAEIFLKSGEKAEDLKKGLAIVITGVKRRLGVKITNNRPELQIMLRFKGNLLEYHWDSLDEKKTQTKLEKKWAAAIRSSCLQVIHYTQKIGSDPIGFGNLIRANYYKEWERLNWTEAYQSANIKVDVLLDLDYYGLIK